MLRAIEDACIYSLEQIDEYLFHGRIPEVGSFTFDPGGHGLDDKHNSIGRYSIVYDPKNSPLNNNGIDSEHDAISSADTGNTFAYDPGGYIIDGKLVFDPGGDHFHGSMRI
jgi:hypothetical protein